MATPADTSATLLRGLSETRSLHATIEPLRVQLQTIKAASSAVVVMGIDSADIKETEFSAYGIIVPHILNRNVIAVSFASNKFAHRAPQGKRLVRVFIGGALQGQLVDQSDEELHAMAIEELDRLVGYAGQPHFIRVHRWRNSMPQYTLGHEQRVDSIESLVVDLPGIELAGKSYRGVGIPACIHSGRAAARRLLKATD